MNPRRIVLSTLLQSVLADGQRAHSMQSRMAAKTPATFVGSHQAGGAFTGGRFRLVAISGHCCGSNDDATQRSDRGWQ